VESPKASSVPDSAFFVIGWTVGFFVPHVVESSLTESILNGLLGVVGLLAAIAILALID